MNFRRFVAVPLVTLLLACGSAGSVAPLARANAPTTGQKPNPAASEVESAIRAYYRNLKLYDFAGMGAGMTPDFQITYRGQQIGGEEFLMRHREEERVKGPTSSRPRRMMYQLSDFKTVVASDLAVSTFLESNPGADSYHNLFVLKRSRDGWLISHLVHIILEQPKAQ